MVFTFDENNIKLNKALSVFGNYNKKDVDLASNTINLKLL